MTPDTEQFSLPLRFSSASQMALVYLIGVYASSAMPAITSRIFFLTATASEKWPPALRQAATTFWEKNADKEPYNEYRYNAQRCDDGSGTYDMGFRNYSPGLNRFLTRDGFGGALDGMLRRRARPPDPPRTATGRL